MTTAVTRGIDRLLRLDFPLGNSEKDLEFHEKRTVNAFEMVDALEVMRNFFKDTRDMLGKPIYRGERDFDFIHDIKEYITSYFLVGEDANQSIRRRAKNRSMVVLLLNPIVDIFQYKSHEETLNEYDNIINVTIDSIVNNNVTATADDAFVIRRVIQKEIEKRNRIQAAVDGIMRLRRRKKRRKKKKK